MFRNTTVWQVEGRKEVAHLHGPPEDKERRTSDIGILVTVHPRYVHTCVHMYVRMYVYMYMCVCA